MKGRIDIRVSNNRAKYRFTLERNITIVRGDSGTGKTTLYDMIAEYTRLGEASGVQVVALCPCVALTDMDWKNQLSHTHGSTIASLYEPLTREEMLTSIDRGLAEADRGEGQPLEEVGAELAAEFGFVR